MLYEIQPTGPARRLAAQQVGYDQKGKSVDLENQGQKYFQMIFISSWLNTCYRLDFNIDFNIIR